MMLKALLIFLIPTVLTVAGIIHINSNNYPEITEHKESVRPGYQTTPAEFQITASPSWRWKHGGHNLALVILGFILFGISGYYAWDNDRKMKKGSYLLMGIIWIAGVLGIFGKYSLSYYDTKYVKLITQQQYEENKTDLNAIFDNK